MTLASLWELGETVVRLETLMERATEPLSNEATKGLAVTGERKGGA